MTTPKAADLLPLALDITASLSAEDRRRRIVEVLRRAIPCDAAALLRLEADELVPVACFGLSDDIYGRRFARSEHPRLDIICSQSEPTLFPAHSDLPDPYDGLVAAAPELGGHVHSCLGCPLRVEGRLVGVLTADALEPGAFDSLDSTFLAYLSALSGAALRTSDLIEALESRAERQGIVARDLVQDARDRRGTLLIGTGPDLSRIREEIDLIARTEFPVLVTGETGTGKEVIVRLLHAQSARAEQPLVYVNCAALPEAIAESELFGHTKGAFTGADKNRLGKFRAADGASLFLDEIGELPLHIQPKLLRVLQEGEVQCVGDDRSVHVDVRVFAATNRDLEAEVAQGRFRADLLHRLDVCRITIPPLRERPEDIVPLMGHLSERVRRRLGTGPIRFGSDAQRLLQQGAWPGNVRELENAISRAVLRASARVVRGESILIRAGDLEASDPLVPSPEAPRPVRPSGQSLRDAVRDYQREMIRDSVQRNADNWAAAARDLGMERANLHHLAVRLGLK